MACQRPHVPRCSAEGLTTKEFVTRFADPGQPVLLLDIVPKWLAYRRWRHPSSGGPNFAQLQCDFQGASVPVVECPPLDSGQPADGYGMAVPETWDAGDYFAWAATRTGATTPSPPGQEGDSPGMESLGPAVAEGVESLGPAMALGRVDDRRLLYLKDWHFLRDCSARGLERPYDAPSYLAAPLHDWLNLYWEERGDSDYRFCYVGVEGTSTALHHDVLCSHSWSANVAGRKLWILYRPELGLKLVDCRGDAAPSAHPCHRPENWQHRFPQLDDAWEGRVEVVQEEGELLFVPSGWYHEVINLTDVLSINHNWLNASNCANAWVFLQSELDNVRRCIGDLRGTFDDDIDFETHCQTLMRANSSMDCSGWLELLALAAEEASRCCAETQPDTQEAHPRAVASPPASADDQIWAAGWAVSRLRVVAEATLGHAGAQGPWCSASAERLTEALKGIPAAGAFRVPGAGVQGPRDDEELTEQRIVTESAGQ